MPIFSIAYGGQLAFTHAGDIDPIDQNLAAGGRIKTGNDTQEGRFARARGPDDGHEFAMGYPQADPF